MVCSIFVLLMVSSATWPFFEINGHTGTVGQILVVSIFAGLEKCFHLFTHDLFSSSLEVLDLFYNSFCEKEISRADCKSMVSCRNCSHVVTTPAGHPKTFLHYCSTLTTYRIFFFQVDNLGNISVNYILFARITNLFYLNPNACFRY